MNAPACPRCRASLSWVTTPGFGAHVCPACQGMWVERQAWDGVVQMTERAGRTEVPAPDPRGLRQGAPVVACVVCGATCTRIHSWSRGVEVDACAPHGLWFDRDELQTILNDVARCAQTLRRRSREGSSGGAEWSRDVEVGDSFVEVSGHAGHHVHESSSTTTHDHQSSHSSHHDAGSSSSFDSGGGSFDTGGGHHHH